MLVLSRKKGQHVVINPDSDSRIEVHVLRVRGDKVVIGVLANADQRVFRNELLDKKRKPDE